MFVCNKPYTVVQKGETKICYNWIRSVLFYRMYIKKNLIIIILKKSIKVVLICFSSRFLYVAAFSLSVHGFDFQGGYSTKSLGTSLGAAPAPIIRQKT